MVWVFSKLTFFLCFDSIFCNSYNFVPLFFLALNMVVKVTMLSHIYFLLFKKISPFGIIYIYIYIYTYIIPYYIYIYHIYIVLLQFSATYNTIYIYIIYIYILYIYIYIYLKGMARISANTSKMEKLIETVSNWESLMLHSSPLTHLQGLSLCNLHCALHFLTRKPLHFSSHYPHLLFQNIEGNTCLIQNHLAATGFVFFAVFWIAVSQVLKRQCFW